MASKSTTTKGETMHVNPQNKTHAGQQVRIIVAAELSDGRKLFALKNSGGTIAVDFGTSKELRKFAARNHLEVS